MAGEILSKMSSAEKIAIVIPCYNCEKTLPELIHRIRKVSDLPIWVVNDGSRDATAEIAEKLADKTLHHNHNLGKGQALQTAIGKVQAEDFEAMISIDADLQHPPESIPQFLEKHRQDPQALIIGSRMREGKMPLHRKMSNGITSALISWRISQTVPDSQCGFRLLPLQGFNPSQNWRSGFHFESELLLRFALNGGVVLSVPIPTIYYSENTSYIAHIPDTIDFIKLFFESFFW
jgi:glycosyltransferase involved in cell wall biosynthesis